MTQISNITITMRDTKHKEIDITNITRRVVFKESLLLETTSWEVSLGATNLTSEETKMFATEIQEIKITLQKEKQTFSTGWKVFIVKKSSLFYEGGLPYIEICASNKSILMNLKEKFRAYVNKNPNFILKNLAEDYGLELVSPQFNFNITQYQTALTDWEFLQKLRTEITTPNSFGNLWLFVDDNILFFNDINFAKQGKKQFNFGGNDDRIESIIFENGFREIDYLGGGQITTLGTNLQRNETLRITSKDISFPILASKLNSEFSSSLRYRASPKQQKNADGIIAENLISWAKTAINYFSFHLTLVGELELKLTDIIEVNALGVTGEYSSFNGRYPIYEIVQYYTAIEEMDTTGNSVTSPGLTTHVGGFRRSFNYGKITSEAKSYAGVTNVDTYTSSNIQQTKTITKNSRELIAQ